MFAIPNTKRLYGEMFHVCEIYNEHFQGMIYTKQGNLNLHIVLECNLQSGNTFLEEDQTESGHGFSQIGQ